MTSMGVSLESSSKRWNNYCWPWNNTGLDSGGPLQAGSFCFVLLFSVNTVNVLLFPYASLNFFVSRLCISLSPLVEITQYTMHVTYNPAFTDGLCYLQASCQQQVLSIADLGGVKIYTRFSSLGCGRVGTPNLHIVQGQLYKSKGILQVGGKVRNCFKRYYIHDPEQHASINQNQQANVYDTTNTW